MNSDPITQRDLQSAVQSATLATQMAEVIKDIGALNVRMDQHEARHGREQKERVSSRRWLIGVAVAFLAAIDGPLIYLIQAGRH